MLRQNALLWHDAARTALLNANSIHLLQVRVTWGSCLDFGTFLPQQGRVQGFSAGEADQLIHLYCNCRTLVGIFRPFKQPP
jgi:hypothetical protein